MVEPISALATQSEPLDVVVIGAGFGGLCMLYHLKRLKFKALVLETGSDIGGTWFWNRYPGARCDAESVDYSFSFSEELQQEWEWTERYATQPEILRYLNHVVDRFDLRSSIRNNERVVSARYDAADSTWTVSTDSNLVVKGKYLVLATGALSASQVPKIPGLDNFEGQWYHTGRWPQQPVAFDGQTVAVVGTGSSGIQAIPLIAQQAKRLYVFQRTPSFSWPARNALMSAESKQSIKKDYSSRRIACRHSTSGLPIATPQRSAGNTNAAERNRIYENAWKLGGAALTFSFNDLMVDKRANDTAAAFFADRVRELVHDPQIAEQLIPKSYPLGAKRLALDTEYFSTFNRDNVTLVNIAEDPLVEITTDGLRTHTRKFDVDSMIFATGFDALTGSLAAIDIQGDDGQSLREKWSAGPRTYLGVATAGFPNMFIIAGPGSPSVLSNVVVSIEQHVEWISDLMTTLRTRGIKRIEPKVHDEDAWIIHVNAIASQTLFMQADSWYLGANIPGKPRVFMPYIGGVGAYRKICEEVARDNYRGFELTGSQRLEH